jgi:hypothetical protein
MPAKKQSPAQRRKPKTVWDEIDQKLKEVYRSPELKGNPKSQAQDLISEASDLYDIAQSALYGTRRQCPNGGRIPGGL